MNNKFDNKNTVNYTHKGPIGFTKRLNASVFYENTLQCYSKKDYDANFARDKMGFSYSIFKNDNQNKADVIKFLTNVNSHEPALQNGNKALSLRQALGLRQNGWTLDRLLMRTRDMQYAAAHKKDAKVFGERFSMPANEQHLSIHDIVAFMQADRIATTPSVVSNLYTKQQLESAGYSLTSLALPVYSLGDQQYYDLSSCVLTDQTKYDAFLGNDAKDIALKLSEPKERLEVVTTELSSAFNIKITPNANQEQTNSKVSAGGLRRKLGAKLSRLNTGINSPVTNNAQIVYNPNAVNTQTVLDILNQVSNITVAETIKEYEKTATTNYTVYKANKEYITKATSALVAIDMCKMGLFDNEDAKVLSKLQQVNATRELSNFNLDNLQDEVFVMDAITQVYSVALRRVAKALNLNIQTFAEQSGVSFTANVDKIFDDVLTKHSYNLEVLYSKQLNNIAGNAENNTQNPTEQEVEALKLTALPPAEDKKLLKPGNPVKQKIIITPAPQKNEEVIILGPAKKPEKPLINEKLKTSYKPADDYGFEKIEIEDAKDIKKASKRLSSRINKDLIKKVNAEIVKPAISQIMDEHPDYMDDTKDDLCATIRIYNEIIKAEDLPEEERAAKLAEIKQKMIKVGEQDYLGDRKRVVEKALNLYELTYKVYKDVVSYKKQTKGLEDSTAVKTIIDNYIRENGGQDVVQGEVRELMKDKVFEFEDSKTL